MQFLITIISTTLLTLMIRSKLKQESPVKDIITVVVGFILMNVTYALIQLIFVFLGIA